MKHLLLSVLFTFAVAALPAAPSESIGLYARSGKDLLPLEAIEGPHLIAVDDEGNRLEMHRHHLVVKGEGAPSLVTGYSPAHYLVQRSEWDHHADDSDREPPYHYTIEVTGLRAEDAKSAWGEFDLTRIWPAEELSDPDALLVVAWWNPKRGWSEGAMAHAFIADGTVKWAKFRRREGGLNGFPHVMLWKKGEWIPPRIYADAARGTLFANLQDARSQPGKDQLLEAAKAKDSMGLNWMHYAAAWGRDDWIRQWIEAGQKIRLPKRTLSPLTLAAMHGHAHVIKDLVDAGVRLSELDDFGYEPGHFAILYGHKAVVETMLELGYSPNSSARDTIQTPLGIAFTFGFDDIFGLLREKGGRFRTFNSSAADGFLKEAALKGNANMMEFIIEEGGDVNDTSDLGWKPLSLAVRSGNPEAVRVLLEAGADPDTVSGDGRSALWDAVVLGEREVVHLLLEYGALKNPLKESPIGYVELATFLGDRQTVRELMDAGVECSMTDQVAPEILVQAVRNDIPEMAQLAFGQCVQEDFLFYEQYSMDFLVDYYNAEETHQWWENSGFAFHHPAPLFAEVGDLDAQPRLIAGQMPKYDADLFKRYGKITTRVVLVINDDGRVLFPQLEETLPRPLQLDLLTALSTWRFEPLSVDGEPVRLKARLPVVLDNPEENLDAMELQEVSTPPKPIERVPPYYPRSLVRSGTSGTVLLHFIVDEKGAVRFPRVIRSPHPLLSNVCVKTVALWKFEPATKNGKPVDVHVRLPMPFRIR